MTIYFNIDDRKGLLIRPPLSDYLGIDDIVAHYVQNGKARMGIYLGRGLRLSELTSGNSSYIFIREMPDFSKSTYDRDDAECDNVDYVVQRISTAQAPYNRAPSERRDLTIYFPIEKAKKIAAELKKVSNLKGIEAKIFEITCNCVEGWGFLWSWREIKA